MLSRITYPLLFSLVIIFSGSDSTFARQTLGIVWDIPETEAEALHHLDRFTELGIEVIEINHPVRNDIHGALSGYDFSVFVRAEEKYYIVSEINQQQRLLSEKYMEFAGTYRTDFNVAAIGLLSHSQLYNDDHLVAFSPIIDTLELASNKDFYFVQGYEWFYFRNPLQEFARSISGPVFRNSHLDYFNAHLTDSVFTNPDFILFMHSGWLFDGIEAHPEFENSLIEYENTGTWLLPLPNVNSGSVTANWSVLLLLTLWAILAIQFRFLPVSGAMIVRYFLAHRFFADDILHFRERSAAAGYSIMTLHIFFGGLVLYILANTFISEIGVQAFFDHVPGLAITGSNYTSFFFLGIIFFAVMQAIALLWIYLPNQNLEHFSQAVNLYSGIFYFDFVLVTIMLTVFLSTSAPGLILALSILFIICWFSAFYIAAGDASKYMGAGKIIYLLITVGIHTAATALFIILFLNSPDLLEVIDLAINL